MGRVSIQGLVASVIITFSTLLLLMSNSLLPMPEPFKPMMSEYNNISLALEQAKQQAETDNPSIVAQAYFYVSNVFTAFKLLLSIPLVLLNAILRLLDYIGIPPLITSMVSLLAVLYIVIALIRRRID